MKLKVRKLFDPLLILLYLLIVFDYVLTYIGVKIFHVIGEANPLISIILNLPFQSGIVYRCILSALPILLLIIVKNKYAYKHYNKVIAFLLLVQIIPYSMHFIWILNTVRGLESI